MSEISPWISVGTLGAAFAPDNNALPIASDFAGKTMTLNFENGWSVEHVFLDGGKLHWRGTAGEVLDLEGLETYTVTRPRPGIYFVDFIKAGKRATSVSMVFDLNRAIFTALIGRLPTVEQTDESFLKKIAANKPLTGVSGHFFAGRLTEFSVRQRRVTR